MTSIKNENQATSLHVTDDLTVTVILDSNHEFLMNTKEVSLGYGVSDGAVRINKLRHQDELIEGTHFVTRVTKSNAGTVSALYWTKAGVIRLGFYIKSDRARLFRDWVENLVLAYTENKIGTLPQTPKRKHNRLTSERLLSIMADVCRIEDAELRISISTKLMQGGAL